MLETRNLGLPAHRFKGRISHNKSDISTSENLKQLLDLFGYPSRIQTTEERSSRRRERQGPSRGLATGLAKQSGNRKASNGASGKLEALDEGTGKPGPSRMAPRNSRSGCDRGGMRETRAQVRRSRRKPGLTKLWSGSRTRPSKNRKRGRRLAREVALSHFRVYLSAFSRSRRTPSGADEFTHTCHFCQCDRKRSSSNLSRCVCHRRKSALTTVN